MAITCKCFSFVKNLELLKVNPRLSPACSYTVKSPTSTRGFEANYKLINIDEPLLCGSVIIRVFVHFWNRTGIPLVVGNNKTVGVLNIDMRAQVRKGTGKTRKLSLDFIRRDILGLQEVRKLFCGVLLAQTFELSARSHLCCDAGLGLQSGCLCSPDILVGPLG
jgi:hypothetical protein